MATMAVSATGSLGIPAGQLLSSSEAPVKPAAVTPTKASIAAMERHLVALAKEGHQEAFASLFEAHKRRVYSLCLQLTGDSTEAEDLAQDAFIQAFRKLATFRGDSAFSTWLYRVAMNTVLMKLRKRSLRQVSIDEPIETGSSSVPREYGKNDSRLMGTIDRIALVRAVEELPEGYRMIFVLHDVEGYGHREIARRLNCTTGNSKSQLHKARLKIREFLRASVQDAPKKKSRRSRGSEEEKISRPALDSADARRVWDYLEGQIA
jgi:RNA polymerase sigma-70 factor (ECF subfamily)